VCGEEFVLQPDHPGKANICPACWAHRHYPTPEAQAAWDSQYERQYEQKVKESEERRLPAWNLLDNSTDAAVLSFSRSGPRIETRLGIRFGRKSPNTDERLSLCIGVQPDARIPGTNGDVKWLPSLLAYPV
jgi:hypothetical protein